VHKCIAQSVGEFLVLSISRTQERMQPLWCKIIGTENNTANQQMNLYHTAKN